MREVLQRIEDAFTNSGPLTDLLQIETLIRNAWGLHHINTTGLFRGLVRDSLLAIEREEDRCSQLQHELEAERKGRLAAEARLAAVREAVTVHPAPRPTATAGDVVSVPLRARVTEMNTTRDHTDGPVRQTVELDMFDGCEIAKAGTTAHRDELQRSVRALEGVLATRDKELHELHVKIQNVLGSRKAFERELSLAVAENTRLTAAVKRAQQAIGNASESLAGIT
jgi:hypothetical protein